MVSVENDKLAEDEVMYSLLSQSQNTKISNANVLYLINFRFRVKCLWLIIKLKQEEISIN